MPAFVLSPVTQQHRVTRKPRAQNVLDPPRWPRQTKDISGDGGSPGVRLSQPLATSSLPITLTARLNAEDT